MDGPCVLSLVTKSATLRLAGGPEGRRRRGGRPGRGSGEGPAAAVLGRVQGAYPARGGGLAPARGRSARCCAVRG